ncbi:hypothetical protein J6590_035768 [Homalodisca vitripennis]|nr:hypothetical protein J6590_035768 [Homalodisca vitripennis]
MDWRKEKHLEGIWLGIRFSFSPAPTAPEKTCHEFELTLGPSCQPDWIDRPTSIGRD